MPVEEMLNTAQDAMTVRRVFGDPIKEDGLTIIPVAKVRGGGGGGAGEGPDDKGKGWGGGFGVTAKAMGAYVVKDDDVRWVPAIDANRAILVAGLVAMVALCAVGRPIAKALASK